MAKGKVAKVQATIEAPTAPVWKALTDPNTIKRYMFGATVVTDWKENSPITWKGEWQGRQYEDKGVVLDVEPERLLRYTHYSPLTGAPDTPENYHTVTIELEPEGERTRISLSQDNNATDEECEHSQKNWQMMLGKLKEAVEL